MQKILGSLSPSDALAKHLAGPQIRDRMARIGLIFEEGRAATAPQLMQHSTTTTGESQPRTTTNTTIKTHPRLVIPPRLQIQICNDP